jgi:serine/threonine protein kinase
MGEPDDAHDDSSDLETTSPFRLDQHVRIPADRPTQSIPPVGGEPSDRTEPRASWSLRRSEGLELAPGTRVAQHYMVTRTIGAGGMGVVLEARDELLQRDVAIKFVQPELLARDESRRRFLDEARAMARVRHPNVVEIFTFGEHEGKPYFVMEYVAGITADTWFRERIMQTGAPPPVDESLGILDQCCRGVSAIHNSGATHSDLKPSNVLLGPAFRVALTDLGLSLLLDMGDFDLVAGTPAYMAPESLDGNKDRELAKRRDVWSLGVMAYEFLTGRLPYRILHAGDLPDIARFGPPLPPSQLRSDLPSAFDAVLLRALAADPRMRTPSADAFRRDLLAARRQATERKYAVNILVVDDDPDFLALVDRSLRASFPGATVVCVPDGARALEEAEGRPYDLFIVDLRLPDLNGIELTASLRAIEIAQKTPILIVTAFGGGKDWQLLSSLGANGFLVKPVDPNGLAAMVGRMLESPRAARQSIEPR